MNKLNVKTRDKSTKRGGMKRDRSSKSNFMCCDEADDRDHFARDFIKQSHV